MKSSLRKLLAALTLILSLGIGSCTQSTEKEVAMIALIANADEYKNRRIKTSGFLKHNSELRIFVSREDALYRNKPHSIQVQPPTITSIEEIAVCNNQFVSVSGTISLQENGLVLTQPIQIKGSKERLYSKLICNHTFN